MSRRVAASVAEQLGLNGQDRSIFCDLVEVEHGRTTHGRIAAQSRLDSLRLQLEYKTLELDAFKAISDWHHFAILQLMKLPGFRIGPARIAKALEIPVNEAREALKRLERLHLIRKEKGHYVPLQDYVASPDGVPSEAIRSYHRQILSKAIDALSSQPVEERDFSSIVMPVSSAELDSVRRRIKGFRRKLCRSVSSTPQPDSVYCLSMQFFRLANPERTS